MGKSILRRKAAQIVADYRSWKQKKAFKKHGEETLSRTFKAFKDINRIMWLDYGTLLGAIRDKDFISYDADLDVASFIGNPEEIEESMNKQGLRKIRQFEVDGIICEQTYEYKGSTIDIFLYTREEDKIWAYAFSCDETCNVTYDKKPDMLTFKGWKTTKSTFTYKGFTKLKFKGCEFDIPADADLYLTEAYGNYKVRVKNFNASKLAPNITKCDSVKVIGREYYY